jgi:hypothetical protein
VTAIACTLGDDDRVSRQQRWLAVASRGLLAAETTDRGLRLAFAAGPRVRDELRRLAELERECCAFAAWTVEERHDRVVLDVSALSDEGVPAVQGMFRPLRALL